MLVAKEHADYAQAFQGEDDPRLDEVSRAVKRFGYQQDALIEVLHIAQHAFGYLDEKLLTYIAQQMKLPLGWVYGVASFYNFFRFNRRPPIIALSVQGQPVMWKGHKKFCRR